MKPLDLTGSVFGRLTVVAFAGADASRCKLWRCVCECGGEVTTRGSSLRAGNTRSCGCLNIGGYKHGQGVPGENTRTYRAWTNMRYRCTTPTAKEWPDYGGRGITIDPSWSSFEVFFNDMGEAPAGLTLDRKDNNGNYGKANCRWATRTEQQRNRRVNLLIEFSGQTKCLTAWCEDLGVPYSRTYQRLKAGKSLGEVFTTDSLK